MLLRGGLRPPSRGTSLVGGYEYSSRWGPAEDAPAAPLRSDLPGPWFKAPVDVVTVGSLRAPEGRGFTTLYERWIWEQSVCIMGLELSGTSCVEWGDCDDGNTKQLSVVVPRAKAFRPNGAELREAVKRAGTYSVLHLRHGRVRVVFDVDIFAWVGWLLSRAEEYTGQGRDDHGRFSRSRSLAYQAGLAELPIVDIMLGHLRDGLVQAADSVRTLSRRVSPWPDGKTFAIWMSHDIDNAASRSLGYACRKLLAATVAAVTRDPELARRRCVDALGLIRGGAASPYWMMDEMASRERARGFRSTFFVLPHLSRWVMEGSKRVRRYSVRDRNVQRMLQRLVSGGWELALHTRYDAHDEPSGIDQDWATLQQHAPSGSSVRGARSHYLRLRIPDTLVESEAVGMVYDATSGWPRGWGFRSGSAFPYIPFDLEVGRRIELWELELNLMDVALPVDEFGEAVERLLCAARGVYGCASILVHPTPYGNMTVKSSMRHYESTLDRIMACEDAWVATASQIAAAMGIFRDRMLSGRG